MNPSTSNLAISPGSRLPDHPRDKRHAASLPDAARLDGCQAAQIGCAWVAGERGDGLEQQRFDAGLRPPTRRARNSATARRCSAWAASWRGRAARAGLMAADAARCRALAGQAGWAWSVPGELGDGFLGAGIVHEVFVGGCAGDERSGGGVVEGGRRSEPTRCSRAIASEDRATACDAAIAG